MIRIENLHVNFSGFCLKDINLSVEGGEFFVLLGPTGAGKTVLLEAMAGLIPIKKGKIYLKGINITDLPSERRDVGIVYQDYALFPHLTVLKNITYGVHFHKIDKNKAKKQLNQLLEQLKLFPLVNRLPTKLSGGELQRVALARALMVNPSVLLLDEPISALDPNFKEEIREELKKLHQEMGVTFFMVTHDFTDVLSLATKTAVINRGKIEQVGEVADIFQRPCSSFVANFVGVRNIFYGRVINKGATTCIDTGKIKIEVVGSAIETKEKVYFIVRPEDIIVSKTPVHSSARNCCLGKIVKITNRGAVIYLTADIGERITALITKASFEEMDIKEGNNLYFIFKASAVHLFR